MKNESVWGFLTLCLEFYAGDILRGRMAGPAAPERLASLQKEGPQHTQHILSRIQVLLRFTRF